jgi:uncharacterized protein
LGDKLNNNNSETDYNAPLSKIHPAVFVLLSLIVVFITYQVFGGILSYLILGEDIKNYSSQPMLTRIIVSFAQFMFILVPVILLSILQGNKSKITFRLKTPKTSVFWLGMLGMAVVQPALQSYLFVQNKILMNLPFGTELISKLKELLDVFEQATLNLVTAQSIPEFILVVFVIAVTPALCEEFFFRGLILNNFERVMPYGKSIFLTGFIFAIFHFHPFNLIPLIVLGFYLTYVVYYSGSIWTGAAAHFINNFLSAYLVFRFGSENFDKPDGSFAENSVLLVSGVFSLILFLIILVLIKRNGTDRKNKIVVNV